MSKKEIFEALRQAAVIQGQEVTKERLQIFTEKLSQYETDQVRSAIFYLCETQKFFPALSEILDVIKKEDDRPNEIASKIIEAVRMFGPYQTKEASEYLGGYWDIAQRFGWDYLCQMNNSEVSSARAQLRMLATERIESGRAIDFKNKRISSDSPTHIKELLGEYETLRIETGASE